MMFVLALAIGLPVAAHQIFAALVLLSRSGSRATDVVDTHDIILMMKKRAVAIYVYDI